MKFFLKTTIGLLLVVNFLNAKVGVCEVQPEAKKEQYLACLVKEAERTDDVADINMVASAYNTYAEHFDKVEVWYKKSIAKDDVKAMYELANLYTYFTVFYKSLNEHMREIIGEPQKILKEKLNQPKKAIELYKKAALLNYKDSIAKLSEVMEAVYGREGAIKEYKKEMAQGDKNSYRFLANLYVRYEEYGKALKLYETQLKKEPKNGDLYALIGSLYATYFKDEKQAVAYFKKAAELGNASAMYNLGIRAGDAGEYDKAEAYFRASEKAGRKNTLGMICYMYQTKLNDDKKAEECNIELAKKGNPVDIFETGLFFMKSHKDKEAIYWYKKAYELGNASAPINLGYMYDRDNQKEKAIYWYKKAAGMGEPGGWSYLYEQEVFK